MPILCELKPRHDVTPDDLKALGTALHAWCQRELGGGLLVSIDGEGLANLLKGEPPSPLAVQIQQHNPGASWEEIKQNLGPLAGDRSVRFSAKDAPHCTRE